jgi:two-component system chemotaxis response regulator CheB
MIRCLVADDSRVFRAILRAILCRARNVEIVGEAADGDEAVRKVLELRPDVVTMDVRMPGKDGLTAIGEIMRRAPTPIIVVSAEAGPERQELSFHALQLGAIEVLGKPRTDGQGRFEREAEEIREAVQAVAGLDLRTLGPGRGGRGASAAGRAQAAAPARTPWPPLSLGIGASPRVVGIAASTGGPAALARILAELPAGYGLPILIVQHIARGFERGLAHWLDQESPLDVRLAAQGEALRPGTVYVAPDGLHLGVAGERVDLSDGAPVRGFRPSGTRLFESLAREYGPAAAGVVLSGMGDDGADGLRAIRDRGGYTAAQGPVSSVVFGMPRAAIDRGAASVTLELEDIAGALARLARGPRDRGATGS